LCIRCRSLWHYFSPRTAAAYAGVIAQKLVELSSKMIKRISMWKLTDIALADDMRAKLLSMGGKVAGLVDIEVGINNTEHHSAYDIVFIGTFSDREALRHFECDEYHKQIGEFVSKVKLDRKVVEFEC